MVQIAWEYPVPPLPTNALMGLRGDGPFGGAVAPPFQSPAGGLHVWGPAGTPQALQAGTVAAQQHLHIAAAAAAMIGAPLPLPLPVAQY